MGETLKRRMGPLPVWAWALIFVVLLAGYLSYRKKKQAAAASAQSGTSSSSASNLGTVPVSNLTTAAQPMPIQLGDTFVSTSVPQSINVSPSTTVNNNPPSSSLQTAQPPTPPAPVIPPASAQNSCAYEPQQGVCFSTPPPTGQKYYWTGSQWGLEAGQAPGDIRSPGYGAGLSQLFANNPALPTANTPGGTNVPGITGYQVSYNGVPL